MVGAAILAGWAAAAKAGMMTAVEMRRTPSRRVAEAVKAVSPMMMASHRPSSPDPPQQSFDQRGAGTSLCAHLT
jgi:hypothetical protein